MRKKLKAMAVGLALVAGSLFGATALAAPAHAATNLGGVSVWNACVYVKPIKTEDKARKITKANRSTTRATQGQKPAPKAVKSTPPGFN